MQRLEVAGPKLERLGTPHGACSSTPHQDPYRTLSRSCALRAGAWLIASHCHTLRRGRPHLATSNANRFEASLAPAPACLLQPLLPHPRPPPPRPRCLRGHHHTLLRRHTGVPLTKTGHSHPCTVEVDPGAPPKVAERRKRCTYHCTLGSEIGGRWSAAAQCFVRDRRAPCSVRAAACSDARRCGLGLA